MLSSATPWNFRTYRTIAHQRIERLCEAIGARPLLAERASSVFDLLSDAWADATPGPEPLWPNDICDDGTPFEFSLAFARGGVELRMLVEPQKPPYTLKSNWEEGLAIHDQIARTEGADLERFERIRDLFAPEPNTGACFALWHAVVIDEAGQAFFKVYLNPQIRGPEFACATVREALLRLGLPEAAQLVDARVGAPSNLRYFSLDLIPGEEARVKIYIARGGSADEVEELVAGTRNFERGRATSLVEQLACRRGPFPERPVLTCFAFDGREAAPKATLHVPVRCYSPDDATSLGRVGGLLTLPHAAKLKRATASLAHRDLRNTRGIVTYVSVRPESGGVRTTLYLSPQLHHAPSARPSEAPGRGPSPKTMREVELEIERQCRSLLEHPFLARLDGEATRAELFRVLPRLAFFVGSFQDLLRVSHARCTDPRLAEVARGFIAGDQDHELWYMADLERLGIELDVRQLFSKEQVVPREVSYALLALATGVKDDRSRIAVTLVLEAAAELFFPRMAKRLAELGVGEGVSYFGQMHVEAEASHEAFTAEGQSLLASIEVPTSALPELRMTMARAIEAMRKLADDLAGAMRAAQSPADVPNG